MEQVDAMTGEIMMQVEEAPRRVPAIASEMKPVKTQVERMILPVTGFSKIAGAIAAVMKELAPVVKEGTHEHFKFKYAKMQDLLQELTPLLGKHGLAIIPTELEKSWVDKSYVSVRYSFTIAHESGEIWPERPEWTGMSLAVNKNGGIDDKCLNKASTSARKYFLLALFNIPTADVDDTDAGHNDVPKSPPKPPVPVKPTPGAKPHLIQTGEGMDLPHWVNLYLAYIATAATKDELAQWDKLNDKALTHVSNKDKAAYDRIIAATQKREKEVVKKPGPPPPPPKTHTEAPQDRDVELVTGGVTPPGEMVWDDPPMDGQQWLRDFEGALSGCTTMESLEGVRAAVGVPAKGRVTAEEWAQGGVLMQAAVNRIKLEEGK